jgi:hypothetical protein
VRGRPTRKKQTFRSTWNGLAGKWRRRDMTKTRLADAVYAARRPVTWGALVPRETGAQYREVQRACYRNEPGSQASIGANVFGSQPTPMAVTRQLPRNHRIVSFVE